MTARKSCSECLKDCNRFEFEMTRYQVLKVHERGLKDLLRFGPDIALTHDLGLGDMAVGEALSAT